MKITISQNNQKFYLIFVVNFKQKKLKLSIKPNLLKDDYWIKIFFILQEKTQKKYQIVIFDLLRPNRRIKWIIILKQIKCQRKLTYVFKQKSDYIFGGQSLCKWELSNGKWVEDNTLSSFIFSQTHDSVYPLKQNQKSYAISCHSNYGPTFVSGHVIIQILILLIVIVNQLVHINLVNTKMELKTHIYLDKLSQKQKNVRHMNCNLFDKIYLFIIISYRYQQKVTQQKKKLKQKIQFIILILLKILSISNKIAQKIFIIKI